MQKALLALYIALALAACGYRSPESLQNERSRVQQALSDAQEVAMQGWTVTEFESHAAISTLVVEVENSRRQHWLFFVNYKHQYFNEWAALKKGHTVKFARVSHAGMADTARETYLAPLSGQVCADLKVTPCGS